MGWNAKTSGGYEQTSQEYIDNVWEIYNTLSNDQYLVGDAWSYEAIVGLIANATQESHLNPWIWRNNYRYGLVQFTFTYYRENGSSYSAYDPYNPRTGAQGSPSDGKAQLQVIDSPHNTLYLANNTRKNLARDLGWAILEWTDLQSYKICDDVEQAVQSFLLFYEYPESTVAGMQKEFNNRWKYVRAIEQILGGQPPEPPEPPDPPIPPTPTKRDGMPLYFYMGKRFKRKKGLL